jgi:hypothetical protein
MKTKGASRGALYESLTLVNKGFEQIHQELERMREHEWFRGKGPFKSLEQGVKETHAWVMFEVLEVLREHEEGEWTRLGRARVRQESGRAGPSSRTTSK